MGFNSFSRGNNEVAIGKNSKTAKNSSVAIGKESTATGAGSVAIGSGSSAIGNAALAFSGGAGGTELKNIQSQGGDNDANNGYRQIILDKTYAEELSDGSYRLLVDGAHKDGKLSGKIKNTAIANANSSFEFEIDPASTAENIILTKGKLTVDGATRELNADEATAIYQSLSLGTAIAAGNNSTAFGYSSLAFGEGANALGAASIASGRFSIALGRSHSQGEYSFSAGYGAEALGSKSSALGYNTIAEKDFSTAIGSGGTGRSSNTKATGLGSLALGGNATKGAQATADNAIAIGGQTSANKINAVALGVEASSTEEGALALGPKSAAKIANSIALGSKSVANISAGEVGYDPITGNVSVKTDSTWKSTHGALSIGNGTEVTRQITSVAAGTNDTDAVNVAQLKASGLKFEGDDGTSLSRLLGQTLNLKGGATDYSDNNIAVIASNNALELKLAKNINLGADGSLTAGNTVVNDKGLSFQQKKVDEKGNPVTDAKGNPVYIINSNAPSITSGGINAGNTVITGLQDGSIKADSTDAINGSQLYKAQSNVQTILGSSTTFDKDGNLIATNIGDIAGVNTVHDAIKHVNDAIKQVNTTVNTGWTVKAGDQTQVIKPSDTVEFKGDKNISITQTNTDKGAELTVTLNKDINLDKDGSLSIGGTKLNEKGLIITGGLSVTQDGINAGNKKVTNIENGDIATGSKEAVNGGQIHQLIGKDAFKLGADGNTQLDIGGTGATNIHDAIVAVNKNVADSKVSVAAGSENITVTKNDTSTVYTVDINENLKLKTLTANEVTADILTANEVTAETLKAGNTIINNQGLTISNSDPNKVVSITDQGINAGHNVIGSLANGVQNSDAVNMGQLAEFLGGNAGYNNITESFDAPSYRVDGNVYNNVGSAIDALNQADQNLSSRIDNLGDQLQQAFYSTNKRIDDVEKKANAGIAAAMALENAPYIPGKYTYAAGAAYHGGENAIGVTLRKTADNGRWSLTSGIAAGSAGSPSVRVGISGVID